MNTKLTFAILLTGILSNASAQVYPAFGPEIKVTVTGLAFDAMEPFISLDGNTMFFNSLNSGGNTNLYYASKVNDSTFTYIGLVGGCYDPSPGHLDGVASLDSLNNFFWVSLRNYPTVFDNLHRGVYSAGNVSAITRVHGDFNIYTPGWLVMDAAINYQSDLLYYCNAFFNSCAFGMPCQARLGVAQKVNDSTFNKLINTDALFANINDTNYIVYAPQVTKDGLEIYYTRILKSTINSEICVSVRNAVTDPFSLPAVIHSNLGSVPEAATPTTDKQKIYYHQKDGTGIFHLYLRYKSGTIGIDEMQMDEKITVYPNPVSDELIIELINPVGNISLVDITGKRIRQVEVNSMRMSLNLTDISNGVYFLQHGNAVQKIIIEH